MIFKLGKNEYKVYFYRNSTTTFAELNVWNKESEGWNNTGLVGIASLSKADRFVKKVGRVVALTNLIKWMKEVSGKADKPEFNLSKDDRQLIWDAYFLKHKR